MIPRSAAPSPAVADRSADARDSADPQRVLADRVEQLYSQMPLGIAATLAIGGIATYELWDQRTQDLVLFWWLLVLLITAARAVLYWATAAARTSWPRPRSGCAGSASARSPTASTGDSPARCSSLPTPTSSRCSSPSCWPASHRPGIPTYAASWPMFALYAGAIVLPFTYVLATFGNRLFAEIALLVPVFYLANVGIAYRLNQVFYAGYRLRHAYGRLTEDYTALNKRLEQQLVELDEAQRQVEASGRKLALFAERAPDRGARARHRRQHPADQPCRGKPVRLDLQRAGGEERLGEGPDRARVPRGVRHAVAAAHVLARPGRAPQDPQPAARRAGGDVRMERDPAGQFRGRRGRRDRAGPGHHAPDGSREAEEGVHLHPQPRAAHPAHLDHRLAAAGQFRGAGRRGPGGGRAHRRRRAQRPAPARPDQRHPRHREDRIRQADHGAGVAGAGRAGGRVAGAQQGIRRTLPGALRAARRDAAHPGQGRPQEAAAGDDQPAVQCGEVLAARARRWR